MNVTRPKRPRLARPKTDWESLKLNLQPGMLDRIDSIVVERGITRTQLIREAIEAYVKKLDGRGGR